PATTIRFSFWLLFNLILDIIKNTIIYLNTSTNALAFTGNVDHMLASSSAGAKNKINQSNKLKLIRSFRNEKTNSINAIPKNMFLGASNTGLKKNAAHSIK
ncbi:MAG: hypothetical protein ACRDC9_16360, partial [Plesiomonas shigelloides]